MFTHAANALYSARSPHKTYEPSARRSIQCLVLVLCKAL